MTLTWVKCGLTEYSKRLPIESERKTEELLLKQICLKTPITNKIYWTVEFFPIQESQAR